MLSVATPLNTHEMFLRKRYSILKIFHLVLFHRDV
jgi:hypothetical protein